MNVLQKIQRTIGIVQYLVHKTMGDKHDKKKIYIILQPHRKILREHVVN